MKDFDLQTKSIPELYTQLANEINQELKKLMPIPATCWLAKFVTIVAQQKLIFMQTVTASRISFTMLKQFLELTDDNDQLIADTTELAMLYKYFQSINQQLREKLINALLQCLDRDLRDISLPLELYYANDTGTDTIDFDKLLLDLAAEAASSELHHTVKQAVLFCLERIPNEMLIKQSVFAILTYQSATHIAEKLDLTCSKYQVKRINYLYQGLDIVNSLLSGYCGADISLWLKHNAESTQDVADNSIYGKLHFIANTKARVINQLEVESNIAESYIPIVSSKRYQPQKMLAQLATNMAIAALRFLIMHKDRTTSIYWALHQSGIEAGHAIGLKFIKVNSTYVLLFRDVNAGTFAFDNAAKFINWFAEFYITMNYDSDFTKYIFSYEDPNYQRAYGWLQSHGEDFKLQLAQLTLSNVDDFTDEAGEQALQIFTNIHMPSNAEYQQLLYNLLVSIFLLKEKNSGIASHYLNLAKNMCDQHLPINCWVNALLCANIYQEHASSLLLAGKVAESLPAFELLALKLEQACQYLPAAVPLLAQVKEIISSFDAAEIETLKILAEKLDDSFTAINTELQSFLFNKTNSIVRTTTFATEVKLNTVLCYSMHIAKWDLHLARASNNSSMPKRKKPLLLK